MVQKNKEDIAKKRQSNLIHHLKKEETVMKWALVAAGIIILLLLLYIGYATDWMKGLKTDSDTNPVSTSLDSSKTGDGSGTDTGSTNGTQGTSGTSRTTTNTTTNGQPGTNTTTNNSTTERTSTNTTTNNTTTTPPPADSSNALIDLYADTNVGDSLDTIIARAAQLNIGVDCQDLLLVRTCTLTAGDAKVQIRGLLSTGLVTSILQL